MIKVSLIVLLVFIGVGILSTNAQITKTPTDTVIVNHEKVNTYNYTWLQGDLKETNAYRNEALNEKQFSGFGEVSFKIKKQPLVFDTLLTKKNWQKDSLLQKAMIFPDPVQIEKPRYKDFAIADVQYLDVEQGLSSSYIFSVYEDTRKMLWVGTYEGGLMRYNGHTVFNFTKENGLPGNSIRSITEDKMGNMWFGTAGSGLFKFDGNSIFDYSKINELKDLYIFKILEDNQGNIWLSTKGKGIFILTKDAILQLKKSNGLPANYIYSLFSDFNQNIWVGTNEGFSVINKDTISNYTFNAGSLYNKINVIDQIDSSTMIIGTRKHIILYKNQKFYEIKETIQAKAFYFENKENIWAASLEGVYKLNIHYDSEWSGTFVNYKEENGLSHNYISDFVFSDNYLWLATFGGGLNKLKTNGFNHITTKQGIDSDLVWGFTEDTHNNIWFATENKGVAYKKDTMYYHIDKVSPMIKSHITLSAQKDAKSNLWFGAYKGGVIKIDNKNIFRLKPEQKLKPLSVISIFHDNKGNTWFGTFDQGVFQLNKERLVNFTTKNGLLSNDVYDIYEDNNGSMWFATEGGLSVFDGKKILNYTIQSGLPSNEIYTIYELKDGTIWVGTFGGGIVIISGDETKYLTTKNGLSSNMVTSIIQDKNERIWVGTDAGLNVIQKNKKSGKFDIISFDEKDGLNGLDFYANSVFIDSKNNIWWGTGKGITYLDLNSFKLENNPPKVKIEAIQVKQKYIDFHLSIDSIINNPDYKGISFNGVKPFFNRPSELTVSFNKRHVTFYFASPSQANTQNTKYISRLYPLENEWSLPTEEYKADYRGIPPGEYKFEVQAITKTGIRSEIASQHLYIKPPWWMTSWMYMVYIILLIGILGLLHRWRTAVLKRRQHELEHLVQKRTVEIQEKNEELNVLLDQITDQRNEIEVQRDMVMTQKNQLEQINTSISQSIDYAQRIQASLMPKYEEFSEVFPESFLIFKPRDIVSGDFFWWTEIDGKIITVAADCTGHGVPGAFMSILGTTFLREIIHKERVLETHKVLNRLREEIILALKQKNIPGELRDGIEMTIISIDKKTQKVNFSGAYNSIYYYSDGSLKEIKGQKFPVAAYPGMKPFISNEFQVKSGDAFYMFSDGYHDQFGGSDGKKVKKSKFFSLIEQHAISDMRIQKEELLRFLENWQGDHDQIDDILVLGFKIPE